MIIIILFRLSSAVRKFLYKTKFIIIGIKKKPAFRKNRKT